MPVIRRLFAWTTIVLVCGAAPAAAAPCMLVNGRLAKGSSAEHWSNSNEGVYSTRVRWRRGDCELLFDARGDFEVKADLSGFTKVGDFVQLEERDGDHSRRVRIATSARGLEYRWTLDGAEGFDVDRDRWLADILLAIERRTAMFAKSRVPLLLGQGGPDAVLDEASRMDGDYPRRQYYTLLMANAKLGENQLDRVLRQAADSMASDYERSELVRAVAAQGPVTDRLARSMIRVAQNMGSDYEKRRALSAALDAVSSADARMALFTAASTMSSSYEIAELLIAAQKRSLVDTGSAREYFKAVSRLSSDYERHRTLGALLKQRPDAPGILAGILHASESIGSDYELASLLVEFAHTVPVRGDLRELYLKATRSISSDYEYRRALQALLDQDKERRS